MPKDSLGGAQPSGARTERLKTSKKVMRLRRWFLGICALIAVGGITYSLLNSGSHVTQQERITHIESEVKCPSCDGISALDSNTAGAHAVRDFVEQSVKAGKSDQQILNSLEASYGPTILMAPPAAYGGNVIVFLPFVFVAIVLGLIGLLGYRRMKKVSGPAGSNGDAAFESASATDADSAIFTPLGSNEPPEFVGPRLDDVSDVKPRPRPSKSLRSVRQSWLFYLGVVLLLGGVGSGIWIIRSQHNSNSQLAAAAVQAQNEAQTILKARELANQGQDVQALKLLSSVLDVDPNQPVALAYQGWLLRQAGEKDKSSALISQGQKLLEKAVKLDPSYPDARVFLGYILLQDRHDLKGAIDQFNAFLADHPSKSFISATKPVLVSAYKQAGLPVPSQLG